MKIIVTSNQFKMLLDNANWLKKEVGLTFNSNLVKRVLSKSDNRGALGTALVVDLKKANPNS